MSSIIRQAITTKYISPSNTRGSRVKAQAEVGSVTLSWDNALSIDENHSRAAHALANKYKWLDRFETLQCGATHDRRYVFVILECNPS